MLKHKIVVPQIRVYAYHGCLPEESRIGSEYLVDVTIETNFSKATETDKLENTVDYVWIAKVVNNEMAIRSELIEHVANRIIKELKTNKLVQLVQVRVTKLNPPINADVPMVSVEIEA